MNEMVSKGVEYFSETSLHYGPSKLEKHCEEWGKDAIISYANASWPKGTIKCPTESWKQNLVNGHFPPACSGLHLL